MSRKVSVTIYKFNELTEKAKDQAIYDFKAHHGYVSEDEAIASIQALAKHFGGTLERYEVDFFNSMPCSPPKFEMPDDMEENEIKSRLDNLGEYNPETLKGTGECKLTGYCIDEDAIDGFRKAYHEGERDLKKLMEAAYDSWLEACQADCESYYEYENFGETCDANGYEFLASGKMYRSKK